MTGDVAGLPRADWVILAGLLLVAAWAVWYYNSRDTPEDDDD
jgi:hypothetical protein